MYNFSGIMYRIWGVCGIILFLGFVCILFEKPWNKDFSSKKCKGALIIISVAILGSIFYVSRIAFPQISSYTGEFIRTHRDSSAAPPLPITYAYTFWDGEGKKQTYYLDLLSKRKIYPNDFQIGDEYTIYFDTLTNIIVKVDKFRDTR